MILHTEAPQRVPGCLSGHAPKQYPAGRICVACPTVLRRTNPGPWCDPCLSKDAKARRAKEDEVDHVSDADVLAELVTGEYISGATIGKRLGVTRNAVNKHVKNLRATGWHIEATPRKGMLLTDVKPCEDAPDGPSGAAPVIPPPEQPADEAPAPAPETPLEPVPAAGGLDYFNGLRRDWYDGKVEMDVDQLFAFATRMRDELLGKLTNIQRCHVYRLPVVAGDLATGEVGVHWIDGLDQSEVSAAIHDSEAPGVYESVDWQAGPPESPAAALRPFAGITVMQTECRGLGRELSILDELEGLDDAARERVLQYAVDRWWLK